MTHLQIRSELLNLTARCCILLLVFWASVSSSASLFPDQWDGEFKDATVTFLPLGTDWRLLKSQCYQESRLNPLARSPVGAYGLCQFMPGTAKDVGRVLKASPEEFWIPEVSIRAAGYYMGKLTFSWKAPRPPLDRHKLALASYNAGIGHILKAQKICGKPPLYDEIIPCLPRVTGDKNSKETIGYTKNIIEKWYPRLLLE